jgi:hypothetical protein
MLVKNGSIGSVGAASSSQEQQTPPIPPIAQRQARCGNLPKKRQHTCNSQRGQCPQFSYTPPAQMHNMLPAKHKLEALCRNLPIRAHHAKHHTVRWKGRPMPQPRRHATQPPLDTAHAPSTASQPLNACCCFSVSCSTRTCSLQRDPVCAVIATLMSCCP